MVKTLTKVMYKPQSQSTNEFILIVKPAEYEKWKSGDTSVPLVDVVDSFDVFFSNQGSQGILTRPSRQQLENVFGSSNDDVVIPQILQKGREQCGHGFTGGVGAMNATRTSAVIDSKGKGLTGI